MSTEEFQDFSYATHWERFAGEIEQVLRRWLWAQDSTLTKENCIVELQQKLHFRKEPYLLSMQIPGDEAMMTSPTAPAAETSCQETDESYFSASESDAGEEDFDFLPPETTSILPQGRSTDRQQTRSNPLFSKGLFVSPLRHFDEEATLFQRWFGVSRFVMLTAGSQTGRLVDAQEANTILSAAAVALAEFPRPIPILIPVQNAFRDAYRGVAVVEGRSVFFEVDSSHLTKQAEHLRSVVGQLQVFAKQLHLYTPKGSKICEDISEGVDTAVDGYEVSVSSCVTYKLPFPTESRQTETDQESPEQIEATSAWQEEWEAGCVWQPWAAEKDPIASLELDLVWDDVRLTTDDPTPILSAKNASVWRVFALAEERNGYESWSIFSNKNAFDRRPLHLGSLSTESNSSITAEEYDADNFRSLSARLQALLQAAFVSKAARSVNDLGSEQWWDDSGTRGPHIPSETIFEDSLHDMFGDDFEGKNLWAMTSHVHYDDEINTFQTDGKGVSKCALSRLVPMQSLTSRLGLHTVVYRNARAVALLWGHFVHSIRLHFWEKLKPLPLMPNEKKDEEIEPEAPDLNACLLHQKLQMLNVCIHRLARKRRTKSIGEAAQNESGAVSPPIDVVDQDGIKPRGVVGVLKGATLENNSEIALNVPVTQLMPVHTSDSLMEEETLLSALHDCPEDKERAAKVQAKVLISDMAAFKAANPAAQLGDFVKWHSPKDWVTQENGEGCLSQRMSHDQNNRWVELWKEVEAQPASEQIPLFDPAVAGERALYFLETIEPVKLFWQLFQIALLSSFDCLQRCPTAKLPRIQNEAEVLYKTLKEGLEQLEEPTETVVELLERFKAYERMVVAGESLTRHLPQCPKILTLILDRLLSPLGQSGSFSVTVPESEKDHLLTLLLRSEQTATSLSETEDAEERKLLCGTVLQHEWVITCSKTAFDGDNGRLCHRLYFKDAANEVRLGTVVVSEL